MANGLLWVGVLGGLGLVVFGAVDAPYVLGPLAGLLILKIGLATFGSLRRGAAHIPDGSPARPVDLNTERTTFWCEGCGTEVLLLVRGGSAPPRHCGERMVERHEVPRGMP